MSQRACQFYPKYAGYRCKSGVIAPPEGGIQWSCDSCVNDPEMPLHCRKICPGRSEYVKGPGIDHVNAITNAGKHDQSTRPYSCFFADKDPEIQEFLNEHVNNIPWKNNRHDDLWVYDGKRSNGSVTYRYQICKSCKSRVNLGPREEIRPDLRDSFMKKKHGQTWRWPANQPEED
ncbi:uncharacterized protein BDZ99DRAFT_37868 [Mytilinidion resinicola]|uniref:Uncharacterized protein n=1 Tax=Mytilinidion resinicola TaxID=574789 RepID=A0A6A6YL41_9PEZI|nr:uncharacterized protein BDZ99DRAFT_37868 [Mytilinidion resinicola]KAF2808695.1 hypothetical protein BDZ99DRAFT_37868 [Mytilinidion resinicola]